MVCSVRVCMLLRMLTAPTVDAFSKGARIESLLFDLTAIAPLFAIDFSLPIRALQCFDIDLFHLQRFAAMTR